MENGSGDAEQFTFRIFDGLNLQKSPESRDLHEALLQLGGASAGGNGDLKDRSEDTQEDLECGFLAIEVVEDLLPWLAEGGDLAAQEVRLSSSTDVHQYMQNAVIRVNGLLEAAGLRDFSVVVGAE